MSENLVSTHKNHTRKIQGLNTKDQIELAKILRNIEAKSIKDGRDLWKRVSLFWNNIDGTASFENLPRLNVNFDQRQIIKILVISICILNLAVTNTSFAEAAQSKETISWAMEALEKLDPVEYLIYRKEAKRNVDPKYVFEPDDKILLTWNLYREIRGDVKEISNSNPYPIGILGVLNTVFERMKSKKYPGTAQGVIFEEFQFSWTLMLTRELKDEKIDVGTYIKLRRIIEDFSSKNFSDNLKNLHITMEKILGRKLPENLTDYHLYGMLENEKLKSSTSETTRQRILLVEKLYIENPNHPDIIMLGKHLFYNSEKVFSKL